MKKLLFTLLCLAATALQAQVYTYHADVNTDATDSCGREIDISLTGFSFPMTYYVNDGSSEVYYTTTASPIHFCESQHVRGYDQDCNMLLLDIWDINPLNPHFYIRDLTFNVGPSASGCDNSIDFTVSGLQGHPMRVELWDLDVMTMSKIYDQVIDDSTFSLSGVCLGYFHGNNLHAIQVFATDTVTSKVTMWSFFSPPVGMIGGSTCAGTLLLDVNAIPSSDMGTCNGSVTTTATGDNPPFTFEYSNGVTTASQSSMCPGLYNVTVTDALGRTRSSAFLIADSANIYYDNPLHTPVDTLVAGAYLNCDIDFSVPFDTIYVDSVINLTPQVVRVTYVIEQDTNTFRWSETYYTDTAGYYCFVTNVFCEEPLRAASNYFTAYLFGESEGTVGIKPQRIEDREVELYPNPASTVVRLKGLSPLNTVSVYDIHGKLVMQVENSNGTLYTGHLPNGTYVVKTWQGEGMKSGKLVVWR